MKNVISKLVWLVIIAPAVYLAIIWDRIPDTVAMHYDLKGNPDRFGSKKEMIWVTAIIMGVNLLVYLLLTNVHRFDPKKYASDNKDRLRRIAFAVSIFMSALLTFIVYNSTRGNTKLDAGIVFSAVGLLFAVIGNYFPNLKPNYFAGLRLPWTLENAENWKRTHALAGRLWFAGGLFLAAICLFLPTVAAIIIFFVVMCVITIIPCVYSYRIYKSQKQNRV